MELVFHPHVDIVDRSRLIPEDVNVEIIYRGYRQCYTKDPLDDTKLVEKIRNEEYQTSLLKEFEPYAVEYAKIVAKLFSYNCKSGCGDILSKTTEITPKEAIDYILRVFGKTKFLCHLHKCKFIASHMMHESPVEHGICSLHIYDMSRVESQQYTRHRLVSLSQQSQRYVDEGDLKVIPPLSIQQMEEAMEVYVDAVKYVERAVKKLKDLGISNEDVRSLYVNSVVTSFYTTMNWRELMHIFNERVCSKAQHQIRYIFSHVLKYYKSIVPFVFEKAGAKCKKLGYCPEIKSCGITPKFEDIVSILKAK